MREYKEPGWYWAYIQNVWEIVQVSTLRISKHTGQQWVDCVGYEGGDLVPDGCWGPKIEVPEWKP